MFWLYLGAVLASCLWFHAKQLLPDTMVLGHGSCGWRQFTDFLLLLPVATGPGTAGCQSRCWWLQDVMARTCP